MRIIESFDKWKHFQSLNENVQAAKQYMLKRFAKKQGIEEFKAALMQLVRQVYKEKYPNLNFQEDYSM
jgi:hypothetical protein